MYSDLVFGFDICIGRMRIPVWCIDDYLGMYLYCMCVFGLEDACVDIMLKLI